jgi:hypothetical protein
MTLIERDVLGCMPTDLKEAVGAAGLTDPGDDCGEVGVGEVDDGDLRVGDDLVEARALHLRPDVVLRQLVVHGRGDELVRHAGRLSLLAACFDHLLI